MAGQFIWLESSVGTVLIFQFSPGFGTEASVPAVSRYQLHGTSVLVLCSRYQGFGTRFSGGYLHMSHFGTVLVTFWLHFGSISVQFWPQIRWNLKLWYWNLNWLEPKLLKIFGTKIQKLRFFRYFRFWTNTIIFPQCNFDKEFPNILRILYTYWS